MIIRAHKSKFAKDLLTIKRNDQLTFIRGLKASATGPI